MHRRPKLNFIYNPNVKLWQFSIGVFRRFSEFLILNYMAKQLANAHTPPSLTKSQETEVKCTKRVCTVEIDVKPQMSGSQWVSVRKSSTLSI